MPDTKLPALTAISAPALDDLLYIVDVSDSTDDASGSSRDITIERLLAVGLHGICQGRLTTETGVAVSTSDRTNQSTLYFTPLNGNRIALYDGTRWGLFAFTERSLTLSGLTSAKNYDVFLYNNAGTLTLELSAAWTNDTTRADALTTQDGILVKSGDSTRRYLGTIRTTGTTTTEDSETKRFVWNLYNQTDRKLKKTEATDNWTYATATWRSANNSTANRVETVTGIAYAGLVRLSVFVTANAPTAIAACGIAVDATNTNNADSRRLSATSFGATDCQLVDSQIGYHFYQWTEYANYATCTFYSANSDGGSVNIRLAGLFGTMSC